MFIHYDHLRQILSLLLTFNSRFNEFAADAFAVFLGKGNALASGLIKISIGKCDDVSAVRVFYSDTKLQKISIIWFPIDGTRCITTVTLL